MGLILGGQNFKLSIIFKMAVEKNTTKQNILMDLVNI